MISFDVESLFTNIPLKETIDLAVDLLMENYPNIRFTFEKEINYVISFLDEFIKVTPFSYNLTTYYKKTYTGLLTNFTSFTPFRYKTGLIRTLVDRAYKINSSYLNLHTQDF